MSKLIEIEAAVAALPKPEQEVLFQHLAQKLRQPSESKRKLPLIVATGQPITQREIDDALDAE